MAEARVSFDALIQNHAGRGLVPRAERVPDSTLSFLKLDVVLADGGGLSFNVDDELQVAGGAPVSNLTGTLPVFLTPTSSPGDPVTYDVAVRSTTEANTALYLVRRNTSGEIAQRVDSDLEERFTGILVRNGVVATNGSQAWSPSLMFTASGYDVATASAAEHHWDLQVRTVQGLEAATAEMHFLYRKALGVDTSYLSISSTGQVLAPVAIGASSAGVAQVVMDPTGILFAADTDGRYGQTPATSGAGRRMRFQPQRGGAGAVGGVLDFQAGQGDADGTDHYGPIYMRPGAPVSSQSSYIEHRVQDGFPGTLFGRWSSYFGAWWLEGPSNSSITLASTGLLIDFATSRIHLDTVGIGFFGVAPVAQPTNPGTIDSLLDSTTGIVSTTLSNVDVAGVADPSVVNNNFASLAEHEDLQDALIIAVIARLQALGLLDT